MFNIAFPELMVILVVALFVIGPDKLPKIAHGAGIMLGRLQRYVSDIKSDLSSELQSQDLKRLQEELEQHDLGFNEDLRRGIQPVESVLQESAAARQKAESEKLQTAAAEDIDTERETGTQSESLANHTVKMEHR